MERSRDTEGKSSVNDLQFSLGLALGGRLGRRL